MQTTLKRQRQLFILILALGLCAPGARAFQIQTNYTGRVSDTVCGPQHKLEKDPVQCTRDCVAKGASYALVVGTRFYRLVTTKPAQVQMLYKYAGRRVVVRGTLTGDTLTVDGVSPAG